MSESLLHLYNRELQYIRRMAADFAEANPKIASRLRISGEAIEDPHVSRLVEAVAYLNARVRQKLDDDFPELTDALLGVLYPHYLAPVPSMAMVQFQCQPELTSGYTIPKGSELETEPVQGEACRFRTCYPVTLWPIEIEDASLVGRPFMAPAARETGDASAVLRLVLKCSAEEVTFSELGPSSLRFFLKDPPPQCFTLYELINNHVIEVAVANAPDDPKPMLIGPESVRPVGFEWEEGMLPYSTRSALGYRLLTEFFVFPHKFLMFEIDGLTPRVLRQIGNRLELYLYMNHLPSGLSRSIRTESFALGCTPMVNLFSPKADPIAVTQREPEYRVVPDRRRQTSMEVYSIDRVTATSPDGEEHEYQPLYWPKHGTPSDGRAYWHASRRPAGERDPATEVFLSLVDLDLEPADIPDYVITASVTCLNRDLPAQLPFGGGRPHLQLVEGAAPVTKIECLTSPTRTLRAPPRHGSRWRLVSHLTLNHLSITGGEQGIDALREILTLYDFQDSDATRRMISGITSVGSRTVTRRLLAGGREAPCRGIEIEVEFDEERLSGGELYLFASVLERFMALHCSLNSFTQFVAKTKGREGIRRRWPPRAGDRPLL